MWGVRSARTPVVGIAAGVFLVVCVLPVLDAVASAVPALASVNFADERQRALLVRTIALGVGTAGLATIVGAPLGFVMARVPMGFKAVLRIALLAPATIPPYVVGLAVTYVHRDVIAILPHWLSTVVPNPHSLPGAIAVLGIVSYPLPMIVTEATLRRLEPQLEEAALLVSPRRRVLRRITVPLIAHSVLAATFMVFVLAISEFSVPALLRVRVYTTEVFTAFAAFYDVTRATALAMPLLALTMAVTLAAALLWRERVVTRPRAIGGAQSMAFAGWSIGALVTCVCAVVLLLAVPLMVLTREAFQIDSLRSALHQSGQAVTNSLVLAIAGATGVTAVSVWLGYIRARAGETAGAVADILCIVLFTVPSTVVGISLIGLWNRSGLLGAIYGTSAMLVVGYLARFIPVAALFMGVLLRFVPRSHEEAAVAAGATWLPTMHHIVLPQVRLGLAMVWVMTFVLAFGEVGTSILIAPPGESTLPIRVFTLTANAPPGYVPALALFQAAVVLLPLVLLSVLVGRWERQ